MTIKKAKAPEMEPVAANEGGAVIADRFKLDAPDPAAGKAKGGVLATITLIVSLVALGVAGALTFVIYQHWEFLKGA